MVDLSQITAADRQAEQHTSDLMQLDYPGQYKGLGIFTTFRNFKNGIASPEDLKILNSGDKAVVDTETNGLGKVTIPTGGKPLHFSSLDMYGSVDGSGSYQEDEYRPSYKYFVKSDGSYPSVQFAIFQTLGDEPMFGGFYRGNTTPVENMPQSGVATYVGEGIFIPGTDNVNANFYGGIGMVVDYGKKVFELCVVNNNYEASVPGVITGSTFVGKKDGRFTEGMFAGEKAEELTGRYLDQDAKLYGVYGAKRQ
ncbi:transferrin-binding protein-like solute binding protein [Suttonella ornithocola]|uniref:Transferrin-binding protein B C-lobe/N-lobe beta-barrel domain-containing protein n=1 Tax=Suttonella ornithocola TaxID=279832 RepID=A0A380MYA1_9GAMM|nr:transferrin-binding protein-like solute binding protein [Suttonella ornithocola]SUO97545.1 Uncharacterised protein [Suttonella ornithocola]